MNKLDYLKLYVGHTAEFSASGFGFRAQITVNDLKRFAENLEYIRPVLRRLSNMTEDEKRELLEIERTFRDTGNILPTIRINNQLNLFLGAKQAYMIAWLIKKAFWIFGDEHFDSGWLIDKDADEQQTS